MVGGVVPFHPRASGERWISVCRHHRLSLILRPGEVGGGKKKEKAGRGGCGGGRGRKAATTPSSPPPPADSPDHRSAPSEMEPYEVDPSRTPVHEPRVAEPSSQETPVPESSSQETPVPESSSHVTPEASGHTDGGEDSFSENSYSEGELVEEGKKVYQRGGTKLPPTPATPDQRWLIAPEGEK